MITIDKAIELNNDSEKSLRSHKFPEYADAIALGNEALAFIKRSRVFGEYPINQKLPGETPFIDPTRSSHSIKEVLESPLGKEPKPKRKAKPLPAKIFSIADLRLSALCLYSQLNKHTDRQPRYTLLSFAGATPKQAQKWRDWSTKHFQIILDYLFNPEPLAEGLVNNRLGLSEAGLKPIAVA